MDGLISRQAAIDEIARWIGYIDEDMILRIQTGLKKVPSAQPERKKGRWVQFGTTGLASCKCGYITDRHSIYNFCPKCGSDMRGEQDE